MGVNVVLTAEWFLNEPKYASIYTPGSLGDLTAIINQIPSSLGLMRGDALVVGGDAAVKRGQNFEGRGAKEYSRM